MNSATVSITSVQLLSCVQLFATPWPTACQASLSITNSWSLLKLMSIESVMPSNHLILCRSLLLLPSIFPNIKVFSNESVLHNEHSTVQFSSVAQLYLIVCDPMNFSMPGFPVCHQVPELTQTHVHPIGDTIQPSHALSSPFSSYLQSSPESGSFPLSQFFISGGQSIGVSASASVLPMNTQDWSLLGWTGGISLQSKGLSRVFSNTTVQKHQFFCSQLSL